MGRTLGIDFGERRIGLAIGDEIGLIAHGMPTLQRASDEQAIEALQKIVTQREVTEIVLGLPRNMDGSLGPQAQRVMKFATKLAVLGRRIHFQDERLTTSTAHDIMHDAGFSIEKKRAHADRIAAQLILQGWLDKERERKKATGAP